MKMLIPIATLIAAAAFQAPTKPPMKMGLWESTGTMKVRQPDGTSKEIQRITRDCRTPENWLTQMGPTAKEACPKANEVWTKDTYSFDVACAGKPKQASIIVHFDSPESEHVQFDDFVLPDGSPSNLHMEFSAHWVSAACGDVVPSHPVIIR
jgi:hypothetical protein